MASQQDLQELLRLITARRVPMITAMSQVKALQAFNLRKYRIADAQLNVVEEALSDAKKAKSLHSACRAHVTRPTMKRSGDYLPNVTAEKRARTDRQAGLGVGEGCENDRDGVREDTLCLPVNMDEGEIETTAVHTNRAPLMLAFAVELLRYTMPEQPLSSRLSLAQAVVSANSRSRAVSLGIADNDGAANDRSWGEGQPKITIMGRSIAVLKRGDYQLADGEVLPVTASWFGGDMLGPDRWRIIRECVTEALSERMRLPRDQEGYIRVALWALDLQRMNDKSAVQATSPGSASNRSEAVGAEIHRPESARAYLSKSFASPQVSQDDEPEPGKIPQSKDGRFEHGTAMFKDRNSQTLARVLGALRLLYESWAAHLTASEMDQRAWSWYVAVRPEIDPGPSGWGAKGWVQLKKILDLRRKS
ncbi:impact protein [Colletotrichum sojae]|uniref:Impact protein n=1 Tax=Colletotrichum sojae TaxID=2175907 RepID=A0A8H6MLB6_9PEZI|nr:impact protein [Colletotrichum sojae]